jgi:hypothetical protein
MRRIIFALMFIFASNIVNAQISDHAIGLRLGGGGGLGTEISYQHGLTNANRLEFDLGLHNGNHYDAWGLAGIYQWVWKIDGGFNWYAGAGGKIGSLRRDSSTKDGLLVSVAGNVGIEYVFPVGIQISLDARPELELTDNEESYNYIAFSIRYQF